MRLKCDGGCNRMFQEYYRMPDNKIFCAECWRRGLEKEERRGEMIRAQLNQYNADSRKIGREIEEIREKISILNSKIDYEKERSGSGSYLVRKMESDVKDLLNRLYFLQSNPLREPSIPNQGVNYYKSATWVESENKDIRTCGENLPQSKTMPNKVYTKSANSEKNYHTAAERTTSAEVDDDNRQSKNKVREAFPDTSVMKSGATDTLFAGRNLPVFVRDYILRRFSDEHGNVDKEALSNYFDEKMGVEGQILKNRLFSGRERVNVTSRVVFRTELDKGAVWFDLPDAGITKDARVSPQLIQEQPEWFCDGEHWGNMTMRYVEPQGKEKGHILMTSFKPFEPYSVNLDYYLDARCKFDTIEWIDTLVKIMGYNPDSFENTDVKLELISRLLPFVEPRLNIIELGPKGTGKSYLYNNFSKRGWIVSGGKITRAKLFFNKQNRQFGLLKHYDTLAIDEIASFSFENPAEMQSIFKSYLEDGRATVDNTVFQSDCGLTLMGNIPVDGETRQPLDSAYYKVLPSMLQESATLDRFHGFIEGWKLPRLESGTILNGWTLDAEYFSNILHLLRTRTEYASIFDELIEESSSDIRDRKAVKRLSTAYHKLLFPQIRNLNGLSDETLERFKATYKKYCLDPAISRRGIIRKQCHAIDNEFSSEMPSLKLK